MPYDQHDVLPEEGRIDGLPAFAHGFINIIYGFFDGDGKGSRSDCGFEHLGFDKARLDRQHVHAMAG